MHTTLIIMAAGFGTRFGEGIKQLAPVGPGGECIMEYSVYDAIEAGFDKVVFIIRKEIEEAFRDRIGERLEKAGEKLGEVGQTGMATGPHLHFELQKDGVYLNPVYYVETA